MSNPWMNIRNHQGYVFFVGNISSLLEMLFENSIIPLSDFFQSILEKKIARNVPGIFVHERQQCYNGVCVLAILS